MNKNFSVKMQNDSTINNTQSSCNLKLTSQGGEQDMYKQITASTPLNELEEPAEQTSSQEEMGELLRQNTTEDMLQEHMVQMNEEEDQNNQRCFKEPNGDNFNVSRISVSQFRDLNEEGSTYDEIGQSISHQNNLSVQIKSGPKSGDKSIFNGACMQSMSEVGQFNMCLPKNESCIDKLNKYNMNTLKTRNFMPQLPKNGEIHSQQSSGVQDLVEGYQVMNDLHMIKEEFRNMEIQRNNSNSSFQSLRNETNEENYNCFNDEQIEKRQVQNHQEFLFGVENQDDMQINAEDYISQNHYYQENQPDSFKEQATNDIIKARRNKEISFGNINNESWFSKRPSSQQRRSQCSQRSRKHSKLSKTTTSGVTPTETEGGQNAASRRSSVGQARLPVHRNDDGLKPANYPTVEQIELQHKVLCNQNHYGRNNRNNAKRSNEIMLIQHHTFGGDEIEVGDSSEQQHLRQETRGSATNYSNIQDLTVDLQKRHNDRITAQRNGPSTGLVAQLKSVTTGSSVQQTEETLGKKDLGQLIKYSMSLMNNVQKEENRQLDDTEVLQYEKEELECGRPEDRDLRNHELNEYLQYQNLSDKQPSRLGPKLQHYKYSQAKEEANTRTGPYEFIRKKDSSGKFTPTATTMTTPKCDMKSTKKVLFRETSPLQGKMKSMKGSKAFQLAGHNGLSGLQKRQSQLSQSYYSTSQEQGVPQRYVPENQHGVGLHQYMSNNTIKSTQPPKQWGKHAGLNHDILPQPDQHQLVTEIRQQIKKKVKNQIQRTKTAALSGSCLSSLNLGTSKKQIGGDGAKLRNQKQKTYLDIKRKTANVMSKIKEHRFSHSTNCNQSKSMIRSCSKIQNEIDKMVVPTLSQKGPANRRNTQEKQFSQRNASLSKSLRDTEAVKALNRKLHNIGEPMADPPNSLIALNQPSHLQQYGQEEQKKSFSPKQIEIREYDAVQDGQMHQPTMFAVTPQDIRRGSKSQLDMNRLTIQQGKLPQIATGKGSRNKSGLHFSQMASQTLKTFRSTLTDKTNLTEKSRSYMKTPKSSKSNKSKNVIELDKQNQAQTIKARVKNLMNLNEEQMIKEKGEITSFFVKFNELLNVKSQESTNSKSVQMRSLRTTIDLAKQMIQSQTQQIMKLLELQVKYGINVVCPEDEMNDLDIEKGVIIQNRLDHALKYLIDFQLDIPECVRNFQRDYDIINKDKLNDIDDKMCNLKLKIDEYKKKISVFKRNEKYQYQGYHALQASNPYIIGKEEKINKNLHHLGIKAVDTAKKRLTKSNDPPRSSISQSPYMLQQQEQLLPPSTQILQPHITNDIIMNPFAPLSSHDIDRVNKRFIALKKKLFDKDKMIQDKIQQVHALLFYHQKQMEGLNVKMAQKTYKLNVLREEYDKLLQKYKQCAGGGLVPGLSFELQNDIIQDKCSGDRLLSDQTELLAKSDANPLNGASYLEAIEENYALQMQNRELENKLKVLKDFILKNEDIYKYSEMQLIFQKLGNIFSKNKDTAANTDLFRQLENDLVQSVHNYASSNKGGRNCLHSSNKAEHGHTEQSKRLFNKYRQLQSVNQDHFKLLRDPGFTQRIQDSQSVPMRKCQSRQNSSAKRLSNVNDQSSKLERTEFKAIEADGMDQCIKENILYPDAHDSNENSEGRDKFLDQNKQITLISNLAKHGLTPKKRMMQYAQNFNSAQEAKYRNHFGMQNHMEENFHHEKYLFGFNDVHNAQNEEAVLLDEIRVLDQKCNEVIVKGSACGLKQRSNSSSHETNKNKGRLTFGHNSLSRPSSVDLNRGGRMSQASRLTRNSKQVGNPKVHAFRDEPIIQEVKGTNQINVILSKQGQTMPNNGSKGQANTLKGLNILLKEFPEGVFSDLTERIKSFDNKGVSIDQNQSKVPALPNHTYAMSSPATAHYQTANNHQIMAANSNSSALKATTPIVPSCTNSNIDGNSAFKTPNKVPNSAKRLEQTQSINKQELNAIRYLFR